ncbi:ABC transporter permease [Cobetia sp. 10Alg 146]|uniref:ABC transporter permease n=1 Tax=Cobetia sp. 10Alg 146 TaxID=3040019 RepID=UPI00244A02D6|nr:ABC transporter permease [Cobetia sp. 10Alg 146]MDH2290206.1 ABC transporter permease [Cobetia sp. 10Alg 146]
MEMTTPSLHKVTRSPLRVTWSVWHALFMREAVARTMADRMAWFWMLFEPIAVIAIMVGIRALLAGGHRVSGAEFVPWMITGLLGFFLFRENMMRSIGAVDANKGLFTYRQVKPIDPVLVRCYLEGMIKTLILILFVLVGSLLGLDLIPDDPLLALWGWLTLWALGASIGILVSVLSELIPEIGKLLKIMGLPLLIISGVIFPINLIPHEYQIYVTWNPIVHGVEELRKAFFSGYHTLNVINLLYPWFWALGMMAFGLLLHIRFSWRLRAQ